MAKFKILKIFNTLMIYLWGTLKRRQDNEHNDTQHNNIMNNTLSIMIFYTAALHNDILHIDTP
jgi:hypothetical protein